MTLRIFPSRFVKDYISINNFEVNSIIIKTHFSNHHNIVEVSFERW